MAYELKIDGVRESGPSYCDGCITSTMEYWCGLASSKKTLPVTAILSCEENQYYHKVPNNEWAWTGYTQFVNPAMFKGVEARDKYAHFTYDLTSVPFDEFLSSAILLRNLGELYLPQDSEWLHKLTDKIKWPIRIPKARRHVCAFYLMQVFHTWGLRGLMNNKNSSQYNLLKVRNRHDAVPGYSIHVKDFFKGVRLLAKGSYIPGVFPTLSNMNSNRGQPRGYSRMFMLPKAPIYSEVESFGGQTDSIAYQLQQEINQLCAIDPFRTNVLFSDVPALVSHLLKVVYDKYHPTK